ncbi:MAG: acyl transferase [Bacteroidetes bacterium]|nr:acyl transferase [Bacteroidota bacterium]
MKPTSSDIFSINSPTRFQELALAVFRWQADANPVYKKYIASLGIEPAAVESPEGIPFMPVEFFKNFEIVSGARKPDATIFTSSGTTGMTTSRHIVTDISLYEDSFRKGFELFYGNIEDYAIFALLPSYLEREGSSLIYMVNDLLKRSNNEYSRFYLHEHKELLSALRLRESILKRPENSGKKNLLLGVTYALLDLIEIETLQLENTIIMETGGMKGKRREMVREELHEALCKGFGVDAIHSEYGMTELLSQGYSKGNGIFDCPPWMQVLIRDTNDPFSFLPNGRTGGINVIDLANLNSCSFIATQDLGKKYSDNSFEVLGRFDNSDIRGCNLLVQ